MKNAARLSALIYLGGALLVAGAFLGLATLRGERSWASRGIGAAWVLLLTTIILMPVVIPWMKRRMANGKREGGAP
ncbi:MAG: hypothetical protein ACK4K2_01035 [Dehalococcoidia bacterium]